MIEVLFSDKKHLAPLDSIGPCGTKSPSRLAQDHRTSASEKVIVAKKLVIFSAKPFVGN